MDSNNITITPEEDDLNTRLDVFLAKRIKDFSRSSVQKLIDNGNVLLDNQIINNRSFKIITGTYTITTPKIQPSNIPAANIELDIIHEDEDIILINKQAGLTTHPGAGNINNTLVNALINYLGDNLSDIGGTERPGIVHRLDKDTSGLIIIAKNNKSHQHLANQLQDKTLYRIYHAITWKPPIPVIGTISTFIKRNRHNRLKMETHKSGGKWAVTHYKLIQSLNQKLSIVECKLETGRTHQIRVHLDHIHCPIIQDQVYGKDYLSSLFTIPTEQQKLLAPFKRQALHAKKIGFIHPNTNNYMEFEVDYPEDINNIIQLIKE